ncbi:MAG: hypothetical protein AAGJ18_05165 [Bacteroidota bacterium]
MVINKFAELNRYIAGASSRGCNNLLPKENLIDWCLANPNNSDEFVLNDEQVFWEVFLESLVKITEGIFSIKDLEKISPKILDKFSFTDIQEFRQNGVLHKRFVIKYEEIINGINEIKQSKKNNLELVDFEQLIEMKEKLRKQFEDSLVEEAALYTELELIEAMLKVAYQLWGSTLQTVEAVINLFSITLGNKKNWNKFLTKQEKRINTASNFVSRRLSGQSVLIDYMNAIVQKSKASWYK